MEATFQVLHSSMWYRFGVFPPSQKVLLDSVGLYHSQLAPHTGLPVLINNIPMHHIIQIFRKELSLWIPPSQILQSVHFHSETKP